MINTPVISTEHRLRAIIAEKISIDPDKVPMDQSLLDNLGLDSFDLLTVILEIEDEFAPVRISDDSAEQLRTLRELADYIDKALY